MFVYTSNVDTAFERVGFPAHRVLEIHGNVCAWQVRACVRACLRACMRACVHETTPHTQSHARTTSTSCSSVLKFSYFFKKNSTFFFS